MADFVRPATRAHWFDKEDDFWETSAPDELNLVSPHPEASLVPHPCSSPADPDPFEPPSSSPSWYAITDSMKGDEEDGTRRTD